MRFFRFATGVMMLGLTTVVVLAQKPLVLVGTITDPNGAEVTSVDPSEVVFTENGSSHFEYKGATSAARAVRGGS